ncbi:MAG: TonB-dependent receptor [candidate division Zixibacteria bacterium]|nr:TonB-dependent receptor [candidate division Zixibacteria bacterium]
MKRTVKINLAAILFVGILASSVLAGFTGKVINSEDKSVVDGATITVVVTGKQLTTDFNGNFSHSQSVDQLYVTVSHIGFTTRENVLIAEGADNLIELTPSVSKLNPIVITAHRFQKESFKVSQPITVFNSDEIESKGYTTVTGIISNAPGVDVNDAGPFRARPVIRSMFGSRTLVLVDGERLNDHREIVDFAGVSMSLVDVNEIERVEVLNGPSSVLYGSDAMGGVINIITKDYKFAPATSPFIRYSSSYSTADEQSSNRVDFGVESQKYAFSAGLLYREANNDFSPPDGWQTADPRYDVYRPEFYDSLNAARGTDWSTERLVNSRARINNYDLGLAFKLSDKHRLDFDAGAFRASDIGFAGVPNAATPFLFFWPNHDRDNLSVAYSGRGFEGKLAQIDAKLYYHKISKDFFTDFLDAIVIPAGPPPNPPLITPMTVFSNTEVKKIGLNLQGLYQAGNRSLITFGMDAWREEIDGGVTSLTLFEGFGPFPFVDTAVTASVPKNQWHALGLFASGEFEINTALLTVGARFDKFWLNTDETPGYVGDNGELLPSEDDSYSAVNGSFGLVVPMSKYINAVANVGTAYRVPNAVERFFYGRTSGITRPNPDIKPERSVSYDLGFKSAQENVAYSLIGFYSDYTDFTQLLIFDTDPNTHEPLWRYENVDDVSIYGVEAVIEANLSSGVYGGMSFSYQHGKKNADDEPIFVSPVKTSLKLGYRPNGKKFFGEINLHRTEDQDRVPTISSLNDIPTRGYTLVNTTVGTKIWTGLKLSLNVNNLFDEVYSQPFNARNPVNPVPEAGRSVLIKASVDVGL